MDMDKYVEKRRAKRVPVSLRLEVSSLFKQDQERVENVNAPIDVINVSKAGIGFRTESILPVGYYFNAALQLDYRDDAVFYCVVKILREVEQGDGSREYGCEFIGFPSILEYIFDELER